MKHFILLFIFLSLNLNADIIYNDFLSIGSKNSNSDKIIQFGNNSNMGCFKYNYLFGKLQYSNDCITYNDVGGGSGSSHNPVTVLDGNGLTINENQNLSLDVASSLTTGALSNIDWVIFNNKQDALSFGSIISNNNSILISNGSNSTVGPTVSVNIANANSSTTGLLTDISFRYFTDKVDGFGSVGKLAYWSGTGRVSYNPYLQIDTTAKKLTMGGLGTPSTLSNVKINSYDNVNNYIQNNIQNLSNGTMASSDWVATADTGTDTTNYIDMGINGSAYSNPLWTISGALDAYLYSQSSHLTLGTASNKQIRFHTGGILAENERMRIDESGNIGIGTENNNLSVKFEVVGESKFNGNLNMGGYGVRNVSYLISPTFQVGTQDAYGRNQIWDYQENSILRLGSLASDGDAIGDKPSEGITVYGANVAGNMSTVNGNNNFAYARIKPLRFGIETGDTTFGQGYIFRVDPNSLYLADNSYNKTFEVDRVSGAITAGSLNLTTPILATNINDNVIVTKILQVDKNRNDNYTENGSLSRPFKTITGAFSIASNGMLVKISGGTYTEDITIPNGVSIEGIGTNNTIINGNINTTASNPIYLRSMQIGSGKVVTLNAPTSMLDVFTNGAIIVNNAVVQAYNSHIISPIEGLVPLTINGATSKYQSILATIFSTGNTNAIDVNNGTLILDTLQVTGSTVSNTILNSIAGQVILLNTRVLNMAGGVSMNINNGATTSPNMLAGVYAVGNIQTGTAVTIVEGLNIPIGTISGSNIQYRPSSMIKNDSSVNGNTVKEALNNLNSNKENILTVSGLLNRNGNDINLYSVDSKNINFTYMGNTNYKTLYDYINVVGSAGSIEPVTITALNSNYISVGSGSGLIKSTDSAYDDIRFFSWNSNTLNIVSGATNYIYVDYNAGNPVVYTTTNLADINKTTKFTIGAAFTDGVEIAHAISVGLSLSNWQQNEFRRLTEVRRAERASGLVVSKTGTRNLSYTSGVAYIAGIRKTYTAKDTSSADKFTYVYRNGSGGWTYSYNSNQISNLLYDNGSGTLATLSNGQYGVHWIYILADGSFYVLYGQSSYTLANAQAATVPSVLPNELSQFAILAAKVLVLKNATSLYSVSSAYTTLFPVSSPSDHNDLGNMQGGSADEYYHLDNNNYVKSINSSTLFTQTSIQSISNTNVETTIIGSGHGTLTLPANSMIAGKTYRIKVRGEIGSVLLPATTVAIKLGSTTLYTDSTTLSTTLASTNIFDLEYDITCVSTGTTGSVNSFGKVIGKDTTGTIIVPYAGGVDTINTTVNNNLDVTFKFGTASPNNNINSYITTIEQLY